MARDRLVLLRFFKYIHLISDFAPRIRCAFVMLSHRLRAATTDFVSLSLQVDAPAARGGITLQPHSDAVPKTTIIATVGPSSVSPAVMT